MMLKVFLWFCLVQIFVSAKQSGSWIKVAHDQCIGAKNDNYKEFQYYGRNTFIIAMKLVYTKGRIGCNSQQSSRWGCTGDYPMNIIVTDIQNKRIYPSDTLVKTRKGGWYDLPGYTPNSPEIVLSDPGFRYLYKGQSFRIWYGEDLYNVYEWNNHGYTCMHVYVYSPNF